MASEQNGRRPPTQVLSALARAIQLGKVQLVEEYQEAKWLQVWPGGGGPKVMYGGGLYYLVKIESPAPAKSIRSSYNVAFINRVFGFVSNCTAHDGSLLPPTRINGRLGNGWDVRVAKFLARHRLLESAQGVERQWLVSKIEVHAFLRKLNSGEITT